MFKTMFKGSLAAAVVLVSSSGPTALMTPAAAQSGFDANQLCLTMGSDKYGRTAFVNKCAGRISVAYCFVKPGIRTYFVSDGIRSYDMPPCELDRWAQSSVAPGGVSGLEKPADLANGVVWVECYNASTYYADITGFDRKTLTARGTCSSFATEKVVGQARPNSSYNVLGTPRPTVLSTAAQYTKRAM